MFIFIFVTYNTKKQFYQEHKDFYKNDLNGVVVKIIETRGTKVYYDSIDFFYTDFCTDEYIVEESIKVGDIFKKKGEIIEFYREDNYGKIFVVINCKVIKPNDSYFLYFFDL